MENDQNLHGGKVPGMERILSYHPAHLRLQPGNYGSERNQLEDSTHTHFIEQAVDLHEARDLHQRPGENEQSQN